jgi:murein endopeptidase
MGMNRPTRRGRAGTRGIAALALLLVAGGSATVVGSSLGTMDRAATERPNVAMPTRVEHVREAPDQPRIEWRRSRAAGLPHAGRLERGVKLPARGGSYFTWDPIQKESPNRGWRRWGTDRLVRATLQVVRAFAAAHPGAPRVGIGDLSRPRGGDFGRRYGPPGHASHQNGLDVDLYYPRLDRKERAPLSADQIDRTLSQDLVERFVEAGAEQVFVGPSTGLEGPPGIVVPLVHHDNHLHVRLPA